MYYFRKGILFFLLFATILGFSQNWEKWYEKEELYVTNYSIQEHYDLGYLIAGNILDFDNSISYPWIIKTTINGDTLWSKKLIGVESIGINDMKVTYDNGFVICGATYLNSKPEPFVAKFNSCGQKEWCKTIKSDHELPMARKIAISQNGDICVIVNSFNIDQDLYLFKFNTSGSIQWRKSICDISDYPDSRLPIGWNLKFTSTNKILVAGNVYWKNPWNDLYPIRSLFALIDEEGEDEWTIAYGTQDTLFSHSTNVIELANGHFIGLGAKWSPSKGISNLYFNQSKSISEINLDYEYRNGLIMELDIEGNQLNYYVTDLAEIDSTFKYQVFTDLYFVDSVAIICGGFHDSNNMNVGEIITDSSLFDDNFNVYNKVKHENAYSTLDHTLTSDNKILCSATDRAEDDWRMYLTKLNRNLEQDSIYTESYMYDYLCDQESVSESIYMDDCDLIMGANELVFPEDYWPNRQKVQIGITPIPAMSHIDINIENHYSEKNIKLNIINSIGQRIFSSDLSKEQTVYRINTQSWRKGLYIVKVESDGELLGSSKFVKI